MIAGIIIYFLYKSVRKKVTKSEIEQDKQSITNENTDRIEKNKKMKHQLEQPLPPDTIRKTLVEWERTLPFHEQRRSYETMQQWLKEFVEQGISRYMSLFVMGKKTYTDLEVEEIMKWVGEMGRWICKYPPFLYTEI